MNRQSIKLSPLGSLSNGYATKSGFRDGTVAAPETRGANRASIPPTAPLW
jgi:hypothetical protein